MDYEKEYKEALSRAIFVKENTDSIGAKDVSDVIEYIFSELKESDDEKIRKELIEYCKNQAKPYIDTGNECPQIQSWIAWLEKQGGQNSTDRVEPKFKIGDKIVEKDFDEYSYGTIIDIKDGKYIFDDGGFVCIEEQGLWKLVEQKPVDKVKPKFNVGDWIVNNITKDVFLIKSVNSGYCTLEDVKGNIISPCLPPCESESHLWTIQDAKDGDVLATPNYIYIFNSIYKETETVAFYCLMKKLDEHFSFGDYKIQDEILNSIPATKEQRDLLFQKMKEAGYEWDADKKELRKIEDSPLNDIDEDI